MFATLRRALKWNSIKTSEKESSQISLLLTALIGILEDILFWKRMSLSLFFILFLNIIFFICIHRQTKFLEFIFFICVIFSIFDAFETWLKHKHRNNCLKSLASHNGAKLKIKIAHLSIWIKKKWREFVYLRETNNSKSFLLVNMCLGVVFFLGQYINGYILLYGLCMSLCVSHKLAPLVTRTVNKIQQNTESDNDFEEDLIPEASDVDIRLLSIEPDPVVDERQSLDYWKPEDVPLEEGSDSSENSSLVTNLSVDKMQTFNEGVETSDSSEDEYIPLVQKKELLQSTLEVEQPNSMWSNTAYNAFRNLTTTVANMMYTKEVHQEKRISSSDSTDGFEMIDKNDLL